MGELGYDNFFFFHFHAGKKLLIFFRIRAQLPGPQQFFSDQTLFSSESLVAPHREQWPALSPPYKTRVRWWKSVHFVKQERMFFVHYVNTIDNDTLELSLYNHQNNCHVCIWWVLTSERFSFSCRLWVSAPSWGEEWVGFVSLEGGCRVLLQGVVGAGRSLIVLQQVKKLLKNIWIQDRIFKKSMKLKVEDCW